MSHAQIARGDGRPVLVIISGAPGSGKTVLARTIADSLELPLLSKDDLKEALFDTLIETNATPSLDESARLGRASFRLLSVVARRMIEAGPGVVIEANLHRGVSEAELLLLIRHVRTAHLHCCAAPATLEARIRDRALRGERHRGHRDLEVLPRLRCQFASGIYEPPLLGAPLLRLVTDAPGGYAPPWDAVLRFLRRQLG